MYVINCFEFDYDWPAELVETIGPFDKKADAELFIAMHRLDPDDHKIMELSSPEGWSQS